MGKDINIFKEQNEIWTIVKILLVAVLWSILITFGVSILCGFRYDLVVSYSMYPLYTRGTMVMIEPTPYEDLKIGDVVNFDFASTTCTHRLVGFAEDGDLITQGDASTSQEKISKGKYRGRIVYHNNLVGHIVLFIRENLMITVIGAMIVLFVYAFI